MKRIDYSAGEVIGDNGCVFIKELESKNNKRFALFRCHCGNEFSTTIDNVRRGNTKSCGCHKIDMIKKANTTHGYSKEPLFSRYKGMIERCNNKSHRAYKNYGGRGICVEFKSYEDFKCWSESNGYRPDLELDRINNNANYSSDNCRWVTRSENSKNKRTSKIWVTPIGEFDSLNEAKEAYGLDIRNRFRTYSNKEFFTKNKY